MHRVCPDSGFTRLMEALPVTLCSAMPVRQAAQLLAVSDRRVWRALNHYVAGTCRLRARPRGRSG